MTSLQAVAEISGWTFVISNFPHASELAGLQGKVKKMLDPLVKVNYKGKFGASGRNRRVQEADQWALWRPAKKNKPTAAGAGVGLAVTASG